MEQNSVWDKVDQTKKNHAVSKLQDRSVRARESVNLNNVYALEKHGAEPVLQLCIEMFVSADAHMLLSGSSSSGVVDSLIRCFPTSQLLYFVHFFVLGECTASSSLSIQVWDLLLHWRLEKRLLRTFLLFQGSVVPKVRLTKCSRLLIFLYSSIPLIPLLGKEMRDSGLKDGVSWKSLLLFEVSEPTCGLLKAEIQPNETNRCLLN